MTEAESTGQEFNLRDYYYILIKRKRLVILLTVLGLLLTIIHTFVQTPQYQATTSVLIERESTVSNMAMGSEVFVQRYDYFTFFNTQYQLITSKTVAKRVVDLLDLTASPLFAPEEGKGEDGEALDKETLRDRIAESLMKTIEINPVKDSNIVEVSMLSPDREMAARLANSVAQAYISFSLESRYSATEQARNFLSTQVEGLQQELEDKQKKLQEYGKQSDIIGTAEGQDITSQRLVELNQSFTRAQTDRIRLETTYERMKDVSPESMPEVQNNLQVTQLKQQITELEGEYDRNTKKFKEAMPEQVRLRSEIEKTRQQLNTKSNEIYREALKAARTEFGRARENEDSLMAMFEEQKSRALDRNLSAIQYDALAMEVTSKSQLLQSLLQRQSEANVTSQLQGIGSSNIRIVDPAEVPRFVFKPRKRRNVALGFTLSLILGVGVAFLLEFLDRTVKSGEEVTKLFGLPTLGAVPTLTTAADKTNGAKRRKKSEPPPEKPEGAVEPIYSVCYEDSKSLVAEAYRSVRTSLLLSGAGEPPRTIVVSSASPGEGKTATSVNLAITLAQLGRRVLLVDTDLRRPKIHKVFLADGKKGGMSHYLAGIINFEDLLVQPQGKVPGLSFITSGPVPPDPSELISSARFDEFVERMYREHAVDHIIFDSPPILSVTDPVILGVKSDGLVLVIHGGVTERDALQAVKERLDAAGVRVLGVVTNNLDMTRHGYYYYYPYYRYQGRYGERKEFSLRRKRDSKAGDTGLMS
jgi:capsular exopolysaccharide synthesis family protein